MISVIISPDIQCITALELILLLTQSSRAATDQLHKAMTKHAEISSCMSVMPSAHIKMLLPVCSCNVAFEESANNLR